MHSGGKLNSTVFRGDEWKREGERGIKKEVWKLGTKHGWKVELADVTYIYSNASSFTIEGNKRDRRIEGRKGKILETLNTYEKDEILKSRWRKRFTDKNGEDEARKGLKIQSRNWPIFIYFHWTETVLAVHSRWTSQTKRNGKRSAYAARSGNLQRPGGCVNDTTTPLTGASNTRRYRACVPIWTWKINLLCPPLLPAPPLAVHVYTERDNPHSPNISSIIRGFQRLILPRYTRECNMSLWKGIFYKFDNQ